MLRNSSRAVTNNQPLMPEYHSPLAASPTTPTQNFNTTTSITSSFLGSPRTFFSGFLANRSLSDSDNVMSPISILETKPYSNPFGYDRKQVFTSHSSLENTSNKHSYEKGDAVGLALVDSLNDEKDYPKFSKSNSKMVLFGTKLKVQIPPLSSSALSPIATPKSPADFGIKTRNSHLIGSLSGWSPSSSCIRGKDSPVESTEGLSLSEMELSEDYTCVITYGTNPKTTHIFDDCVVEHCCGVVKLSDLGKDDCGLSNDPTSQHVKSLRICHSCKENLGDGKDIFMYRGEKAFCSHECRCREMLAEEEKNLEGWESLLQS